ncbi:LacI family transcriptional regulator OS=Streptomyces violarus OX=67380 GN=FHS41_007736 PE=4 SV=1 [Streptomyces violarus]
MAKVTRDDVARLAGTSTAVVSYVINNGPRPVAPATRERVLAAIKELGYRPDRVAQAMASRRTDLIGLIIPTPASPSSGRWRTRSSRPPSERGKMVLVGNTDYVGEREVHYLRAFLGMRVSGLILVSHALNDLAAAEIEAWDARVVLLHERPEAIDDVAVVTDDLGGAQLAVRHLLEHGYEYVACSAAPPTPPPSATPSPTTSRAGGGRCGRPGCPPRAGSSRPRTTATTPTASRSRSSPGPAARPAIFCSTDDQAIGLLRAARELRIDAPGELPVAGSTTSRRPRSADPRPDHGRLRPLGDGPSAAGPRPRRRLRVAGLAPRTPEGVPVPAGAAPLLRLRAAAPPAAVPVRRQWSSAGRRWPLYRAYELLPGFSGRTQDALIVGAHAWS